MAIEIPKDFPWRAGMLAMGGGEPGEEYPPIRVTYVGPVTGHGERIMGQGYYENPDDEHAYVFDDEGIPDLSDPATIGALAGAVREVTGLPDLYARPLLPGGWVVSRPFTLPSIVWDDVHGQTEGLAWLAAWNARPGAR